MGLQAHDPQDNRAVGGGHRRRRDDRGEFAVVRRHSRKLHLKHPGHVRDGMVDEDIQPHGVVSFVHDEALAQEPGHHPVVVGPQGKVFLLHLVARDCEPAAQPAVQLDGAAHLQAHHNVHRRAQFRGGQDVPHDMRLAGLRVGRDLDDRLGDRDAVAHAWCRAGIRGEQDAGKQEYRSCQGKMPQMGAQNRAKAPEKPKGDPALRHPGSDRENRVLSHEHFGWGFSTREADTN